jgi:AcrR family transcriptional regulator
MANVNGAAVNYYFRSKDVLIKKALQITLDNAFDLKDFERLTALTPKKRCEDIFNNLVEGACRYPGIVRAHFYSLFSQGVVDEEVQRRLNEYLQCLSKDLKEHGWQGDDEELGYALTQISSAALMMALAPQVFQRGFGIDMHNEESRRKFIKRLVEKLL